MVLSTLVTAFWGFNKAIQAVVVSEKTDATGGPSFLQRRRWSCMVLR